MLEDARMSDEELRKALKSQARRVLARSPLYATVLDDIGTLGRDELDVELERQALERIRLYGRESSRD